MLTFLWLAGRDGFGVDSYEDAAVGILSKNEHGKFWVSRVTLRPKINWSGPKTPSADELNKLHHRAHEECFIANSVRTEVVVE
jgi:organic hydroperoxide reductase OsmC/OhrA